MLSLRLYLENSGCPRINSEPSYPTVLLELQGGVTGIFNAMKNAHGNAKNCSDAELFLKGTVRF